MSRRPNASTNADATAAGVRCALTDVLPRLVPTGGYPPTTDPRNGEKSSIGGAQGLPEVLREILDVLDAHREAHQVVRHLQRRTRHRGVRHGPGVLDERLDTAER